MKFKTNSALGPNAAVRIRMPTGVTLPPVNSTVVVSSPDGSSPASQGIIEAGQIILIPGLSAAKTNLKGSSNITLLIEGIKNQVSAKDAGDFSISTYDMYNERYYMVDEATSSTSFVATPGAVTRIAEIVSSNPTNDAILNVYTFKMIMNHEIPRAGYIEVKFPPQVALLPSTTLSAASCKNYTCLDATKSSIRFLISNGTKQGEILTLEVGGVTNPRSFRPSDDFIITSYDTDAKS